MIALALVTIATAVLLVRAGWGRARGVAVAGWVLAVAALVLLATQGGAWGVAVGTLSGTLVAIAIVLHAGWTAPAKLRRAPRVAASVTVPHRPADIARRCATFLLVVPVAFVAAQWLAFGAQALARRSGAADADTAVLALFLQPLLWGALMAWQMTRTGPLRMLAAPAGVALVGTMLWGLA